MSCIITHKGKKYSEEQFKEYFINNKQEFVTSIAKNKDVMDSFKRKMEGIDFVFNQSPELASIGSKAQYLQYLSTIFKTSKVKDIVYHGSKYGSLDIKTIKDYKPSVETNRVGIFFSKRIDLAEVYSKEIEKIKTKEEQELENEIIKSLDREEREWYFRSKANIKKEKLPVFSAIINLSNPKQISLIEWDKIIRSQRYSKPIDGESLKKSLKSENYDSIEIPSFLDGFEKFKNKEEFLAFRDKKGFYNLPKTVQDKYFEEYREVDTNIADYYASQYAVFEPEQIHVLGGKNDIQGFKEFVQEEKDDLKPFIDESNKVGDESINERLKKYEESIKIPNNVKSKVLEKIEKETEKVKEKLLSLGLKQEGNKFELITNSYATFRMKLKELENVNAIISTNKTSDFYQIIARLKNVDSTMELKKQGELPFTPIEVKQIIQEQQFLNDVADNVFEELSEEEKQILKKKIENGDYNLNCKI